MTIRENRGYEDSKGGEKRRWKHFRGSWKGRSWRDDQTNITIWTGRKTNNCDPIAQKQVRKTLVRSKDKQNRVWDPFRCLPKEDEGEDQTKVKIKRPSKVENQMKEWRRGKKTWIDWEEEEDENISELEDGMDYCEEEEDETDDRMSECEEELDEKK